MGNKSISVAIDKRTCFIMTRDLAINAMITQHATKQSEEKIKWRMLLKGNLKALCNYLIKIFDNEERILFCLK